MRTEPSLGNMCERCRGKEAVIECLPCGIGAPAMYCYDCDYSVHQIAYKRAHSRKPNGSMKSPGKTFSPARTIAPYLKTHNSTSQSPLRQTRDRSPARTEVPGHSQAYLEELQRFHERERQEAATRLAVAERSQLEMRSDLLNEIDSLKAELQA
jgi:hypothetical protein